MPPNLHPRSRMTTSLFGTTLAVSFLVVGMPHILPCPAPRTIYADSDLTEDGQPRRRRRRVDSRTAEQDSAKAMVVVENTVEQREAQVMMERSHECPVPKPSGLIGQILGFKADEQSKDQDLVVRVEERRKN